MRTVGVEEELLLFTAAARPAPVGEQLASDPATGVEHEFKLEQAEIATSPRHDLDALAVDLAAKRRELAASAAERDVLVAALGSSPVATRPTATPDERYRRMHDTYGLVAADQLTCGTHVHVGVGSRAEGVAAIDGVQRWLAVLLAMTANSPFWNGADSGYASYRSVSWGRWPTAGPTEPFGDVAAYDARVERLIATGAALDAGMIYFDVRLSARYPTVEFRVADVGQPPDSGVVLAALCRAAVETALAAPPAARPAWSLRAATWRAARYGSSADLVDLDGDRVRPAADVVDRSLDELTPALRSNGDEALVRTALDRLLRDGTGADLQRADLARGGRPADVVHAAAARFTTR